MINYRILLGSAGFACWVAVASATTVALDQLLVPGASLVVGDKVFDHFGWNSATISSRYIDIASIQPDSPLYTGNLGIDIQGSFTQFGPGSIDGDLTFAVHTVGPWLISDIHQVVNGGGIGNYIASVSELALATPNGPVVGSLFNGDSSLGNFQVGGALIVPPLQMVWINKDINVYVPPGGTAATIGDIQQTFSQVPIHPAPDGGMTLALLGVGLFGVEGLRRRLTH